MGKNIDQKNFGILKCKIKFDRSTLRILKMQ